VDIFITIIQYVGAVSFTISATIYAIHKRTDIIGALVFSLLTCFGGGVIRDIAIGQLPPSILVNYSSYNLAIVSIVVCLVFYHLAFIKRVHTFIDKHEHNFLLEFTDALGLASFVVSGMEIAIANNKTSFVVIVFAGCITGVGGGILRDICSAQIPSLFRKHIYLIPVIVASIFFALTYNKIEVISVIITVLIIITVRMLAFKFKWNLPKPKPQETDKTKKKETELIIK
jgi:uncharacterized membrane protein YeiH